MSERPVSIKNVNEQRILNLLRLHPGISRVEIARRTQLGKATVSEIVAELMACSLIHEAGIGPTRGPAGRPPVKLQLNGGARLAVGVELTGSECITVLTDLLAVPLREMRVPMRGTDAQSAAQTVEEVVCELLSGYDRRLLLGVGVGVPGLVGLDRRRVIQAVNMGWADVPFADLLESRLHLPVSVIRRQNAGALGEYWHGQFRGRSSLIYISVGIGIGSGIIMRGELCEGTNGSAGEIGHITILPDGPRCACGNLGCLEAVASIRAIARSARQKIEAGGDSMMVAQVGGCLDKLNPSDVLEAARRGDPLALSAVAEAGTFIGIGLAGLANLFNPSMILIGGDVWGLDALLDTVRQTVAQRALPTAHAELEVIFNPLGHQAAAVGAATLALDRFFAIPESMGLTLA